MLRAPTLPPNYLQQSPVRGQLEPCDDGTKWRYLQCTDTPGELKVLLPPATAWMYEQLLKAEVSELAKEVVSWTVVAEIRHLKDRMIRKCLRISQTLSSRRYGKSFSFYTIRAPADFRLKEMEKWLQRYQANLRREVKKSMSEPRLRNSYCCYRCAANLTPESAHNPDLSRESRSSHPSSSLPPISTVPSISNSAPNNSVLYQEEVCTSLVSKAQDSLHTTEERTHASEEEDTEHFAKNKELPIPSHAIPGVEPISPVSEEPSSPPPLPFLWRVPGSSLQAIGTVDASPDRTSQDIPNVDGLDGRFGEALVRSSETRPALTHRRSSLKRPTDRSSVNDIKRVSWAADRDWADRMDKYQKAAREVRDVGNEWEDMHVIYTKQMTELSVLHEDVIQGLHQLHVQTETLQRVEETIRCQQKKLRVTCEQLEDKQSQYQATVVAALVETDHVLSLCGLKREEELDT